ncbi:D-alanyl-D-alanine carboxypeptidase family protein [Phenylobacterium sp. LjRoot219]|uniref:D-alanyl-D-alanine carboxypeptidase family protein n=1 Tax=Phenylobacterium sp. LjRoot219 TaxID=3342283 RepID=UPI003ED04937
MKWLLLVAGIVVVLLLATREIWRAGPGQRPPAALSSAGRREPCVTRPGYEHAAHRNAQSFATMSWAPFGVFETGWDAYAPTIAQEIRTGCGPATAGFAAALADWQQRHGLAATGEVEATTVEAMRVIWMLRRPFVVETRDGSCPPGAPEAALLQAATDDGYSGKPVQLRPGALAAYRRLREAARREAPAVRADPTLLALISGYRSPELNAARCLAKGDCGGPARARCSAHQTGLAIDLYLGSPPGFDSTSSADANRTYQATTPAYQWLVGNAGRFGFVPYPYEPWHWEWTGEPVVVAGGSRPPA